MPRTKLSSCQHRLIGASLVLVAFSVLSFGVLRAELDKPSPTDRNVTLMVTTLMNSDHLSGHPLDNEITKRCLGTFLKGLDHWKLYFFQSDIDEFNAQQPQMVSQIKKGEIGLAYQIYKAFLRRVDERVKVAEQLLKQPMDFTVEEEMISDPDATTYAKTEAEANERWRKKVKYDLLALRAEEYFGQKEAKGKKETREPKTDEEMRTRLLRRYNSFAKQMHQTDHDELLEMYITSLTTAYDPHSTYMSPSTLENFDILMRLQLDGIGAQLQFKDGYTVVNKIIPGGAAEKDGRLKPEDRVVGVGQGDDGPIEDVVDMKLSDVVQKIRGKRGTIVRLEVTPVGKTEKKIYNITRSEIQLHDSEARGEVIEQKRNGRVYRVGVIDLPSFYMDMDGARKGLADYKSTTRDVAKILDDFRSKHVDAVILDLRKNGGGSLTEAINTTGLFIDEGPVVQVKDKANKKQQYNDVERGTSWDGPLVVLTSKFSASASEILAGAIQDYGRGLIVGDHATHGKGTVQSLMDLSRQLFQVPNAPSLGALKITMQQFYRPNGDSTQNRGVQADIELPSLTNELDVGEADLDYAMAFDRIDPVPHQRMNLVNKGVIDRLKNLSQQRQKSSTDFQRVLRNIVRYHEQKARKMITLNEKKYIAEREEVDLDKEQEKELDDENNKDEKHVVKQNYYFNEVTAITLDYLDEMKLAKN
jgi:carboxyl-terminal processing protease